LRGEKAEQSIFWIRKAFVQVRKFLFSCIAGGVLRDKMLFKYCQEHQDKKEE
jgi:hypothetical protein